MMMMMKLRTRLFKFVAIRFHCVGAIGRIILSFSTKRSKVPSSRLPKRAISVMFVGEFVKLIYW